ncbi:hypothetical protein BD770DRAFT_406832 [Pilaira anomala]|nr:hypothetical protein BD770DRAFT_406832 [Pilaira anomala]
MDRRYDQPPRDRYLHSRPRFEERPVMRDERYYRREEGTTRPWSHPRYPSFPQPLRRHDEAPHYYQERREHYKPYDRRPPSRKEPERLPHSRYPDKREVRSIIATSSPKKEEEKPEKEKMKPVEEKVSAPEISSTNEDSKRTEEPKTKKARVYKEAVVSFDSDGEDDVMQADWGNESDDTSTEVDRQTKETTTTTTTEAAKASTTTTVKDAKEAKEAKEDKEEPLPESWAMHISDKGEKYYYNKITRESVWDKPTKKEIIRIEEKEEKQVTIKETDASINKDRNTSPVKKDIDQRSVVNKRKFVLPDRDEPRLPNSLANRISYPHRHKGMSEPGYSRRFESDRLRERPLPPPLPRAHHRYNDGPPLPHPDRYYRSNTRDSWIQPAPYRHHHQMDYAPLPPPPPPRWVSGRRVDFDRRDAPPPYMNRHYR